MINKNHPNYSKPAQIRPVPSSERFDVPRETRFVHGRAPDESVWSYRARLHMANPKKHADPGEKPERRRAWLTQAEWKKRDDEKRQSA